MKAFYKKSFPFRKTSDQTKSMEGKTKIITVAQAPPVAISDGSTHAEDKAPDQETPKNAEEKKTVEIVHDSPDAENTDVNVARVVEVEVMFETTRRSRL